MEGHGNSLGARLAGMHPDCCRKIKRLQPLDLIPGSCYRNLPPEEWDLLYIAGANPFAQLSPAQA